MTDQTNVPANTTGRTVDIQRRVRETAVDRTKLGNAAAASGLQRGQVARYRLPLVTETALTRTVKAAVAAFTQKHMAQIIKAKGRPPSLDQLLSPRNELAITVKRYVKGKLTAVAVMAHQELQWRQADLYKEIVLKTGGQDAEYVVFLPLINADINPAKSALEHAVLNCHKAVEGGKQLRIRIEWVGVDEEKDDVLSTQAPEATDKEAAAA